MSNITSIVYTLVVILITYGGVYILPDNAYKAPKGNTSHTSPWDYDPTDSWQDDGNRRSNNSHYYYSDWFRKGEREHDEKYGKYEECGDPNCLYCIGQYSVN